MIFVTRLNCVAVDPTDGKVLFTFPFGKTGPTVNAATPLVFGDRLFVSASYGIGARLVRLRKPTEQIWGDDESMSSQYSTCVFHDGRLYGTHGREDYRDGELRCLDAETGKVRWQVPGFGVAHLILVGDKLLILTTEGRLVLAEANPDKYVELARAAVSSASSSGSLHGAALSAAADAGAAAGRAPPRIRCPSSSTTFSCVPATAACCRSRATCRTSRASRTWTS